MKLLLDEQVPASLAKCFPAQYSIFTVQKMGWASVKNGQLLTLSIEHGFGALITADKNIEYQQNPEKLALPVIVLNGKDNRLAAVEPLVPSLVALLESLPSPGFYQIDA